MLENKSDLNKEKCKKHIFLDTTQLGYKTVLMLSQTSTYKSKCVSKYSFPRNFLSFEGEFSNPISSLNDDSETFKGFRKNGGFDYIPY